MRGEQRKRVKETEIERGRDKETVLQQRERMRERDERRNNIGDTYFYLLSRLVLQLCKVQFYENIL